MADYKKLMEKLLALPSCTLVTTGRTGTDFLQSLLDSHPEVLTFNGPLLYHTFWNESICVVSGNFEPSDLLDEFIGKNIEKFKSKYDIQENKDQMGDDYDKSINIDINRFKVETMRLLEGVKVTSKNSMVAIYAAYAICLGQSIEDKAVLFHHTHTFDELERYLKDFPASKIISMTRDPRANFVSGIEHWRQYRPATDNEAHLYFYIKRILDDATVLERYNNEYITVRLEDLGKETALRKLCKWLNISYNEVLKKSTWGGLSWHGDRLSGRKNSEAGWSKAMLKNDWEKRLNPVDKYILNYIMFYRLKHYGYSHKRINMLDSVVIPFLILFPLSYELRFFSFGYLRDCLRNGEYLKIIKNVIYYPQRVGLFIKYYLKTLRKEKFCQPLLKFD